MFLTYILKRSLPLYGNLNNDLGSIAQATEIEQSQDCTWCRTISRLHKNKCAISRLAPSFQILRMRSAISRLCKLTDCEEYIHVHTLAEKIDYAARFVALYESVDVPLEWNTGMEYWNSLNCYKILDNYSITLLTFSSSLWSHFRHLFLEVIRVKGHVHIGQRWLWLNPGRHGIGFEQSCAVSTVPHGAMLINTHVTFVPHNSRKVTSTSCIATLASK